MSPVLSVRGLTTAFPSGLHGSKSMRPVVEDVSFNLNAGEVLALVGESGCGKSMTALSVMRLVPRPGRVSGGEISLQGKDILKLSVPEMRQVRGQGISMIFQEPMTSLNPVVACGEQIVEALRLHAKLSYVAAKERTIGLFAQVGIPDPAARFSAYPHQLSGGLKQRVMIAMALCAEPRVLIADEPTTALDVTIQAQILQLMRKLREDFNTAILLITHDLGVVNEVADHVAVMYAGRIVERGTRMDVLGAPQHPYTQGLIGAIPARAKRGEALAEIPGVVPQPHEWPTGCRFCTRCKLVFEPCPDHLPEFTRISESHSVACHLRRLEQVSTGSGS
jgi:peptide/nickel transport system ATP-binding protein